MFSLLKMKYIVTWIAHNGKTHKRSNISFPFWKKVLLKMNGHLYQKDHLANAMLYLYYNSLAIVGLI